MRHLLLPGLALFLLPSTSFAADAPAPAAPTPAATTAASDDLSLYKNADDLWKHIDELNADLGRAVQGGSEKDAMAEIPKLSAALKLFISTYPKDTHVWEGKITLGQLGLLAFNLKLTNAPAREDSMKLFQGIADDKDAPKEARAEATTFIIFQAFSTQLESDSPKGWDTLDAQIDAFQKDFGSYAGRAGQPNIVMLRMQQMQMLKMSADKARFKALLDKLATDTQPSVAAMAKQQQASLKRFEEIEAKPLALKFTAVDGKEVDIATLHGKVVLIDFWATWCPPCRAEMPTVVATYNKYHDKGLEIIGISLDQDKDALTAYTKQNSMPWPQYFDGQGWQNKISHDFGIEEVPTMWLIDQKGMISQVINNPKAASGLGDMVDKLLKKS